MPPAFALLALCLAVGPDAPRWPEPGALKAVEAQFPKGFGRPRVLVDAGHGAPGNTGAASVLCEDEQDFTLRAAQDLSARLEAGKHFAVRQSRKPGQAVPYPLRIARAESWSADAVVSLHFDARGAAYAYRPPGAAQGCWRNDDEPGFAVLYSDEGTPALVAQRRKLASALARQLLAAGFLAYSGINYAGLYDAEPNAPGVWVDRHEPRKRIYFLRRPQVPGVIIETHHALDLREATRWREPETLAAFASDVEAGLAEALAR